MVKSSRLSLVIVPRPCLGLVTVCKGYARTPLRACPRRSGQNHLSGTVGYSRSGPYHEDRTARVPNDPIGNAPGQRPPYPSSVSPPHDDQVCPQLLGERDDLLGRLFLSQVGRGDSAARILYLLDLLIE
jgi:hypothetical protein